MKKLIWKLLSFIVHAFACACIIGFGSSTIALLILVLDGRSIVWPILCAIGTVASIVGLNMWKRSRLRQLSQPSALERARRCAVSVPVQPRRTQTKPRAQKWVGEVLIDAHADLQRNGFRCVSCRKGHAIAEAALIMVERYDEEDENLRTVWHHRYRGLLCPKCAGTIGRIQSEHHRFLAIPPEFRE